MGRPTKITKQEFDRFWEEALGDAWYIEEWDVDDDEYDSAGPDDVLTIGSFSVAWQGSGDPVPSSYMTPARMKSWDHLPVIDAWMSKQAMRRVSAWIPTEFVPEFEAFIKRVGGNA